MLVEPPAIADVLRAAVESGSGVECMNVLGGVQSTRHTTSSVYVAGTKAGLELWEGVAPCTRSQSA